MMTFPACPLCSKMSPAVYFQDARQNYFQCSCCALVFLDPAKRISKEEEFKRYGEHNNHPEDADYREFLSAIFRPIKKHLGKGARGLDLGSGPGPTLSVMFEEAGHPMEIYDPFFSPDRSVLAESYDFITCTETAEHFFSPGEEFEKIDTLLLPGGWLGIMTQPVTMKEDFGDWYYRRDPTHVCFYSEASFRWLAQKQNWIFETVKPGVYLFQKK